MSRLLVRNFSISLDGYAAGPTRISTIRSGLGAPAPRVDFRHPQRQPDDRRRRRERGARRRLLLGAGIRCGRHHHGSEHVRPGTRRVGRQRMDRLVGRGAPLSSPGLRAHAPSAASYRNARGDNVPFRDDGIEAALDAAPEAAGDSDVLVGGGAATIRQYLRASLIDEMHLAIVPVLLGSGERLFDDLGPLADNYRCVEHLCSPAVTHVLIERSTGRDVDSELQR